MNICVYTFNICVHIFKQKISEKRGCGFKGELGGIYRKI